MAGVFGPTFAVCEDSKGLRWSSGPHQLLPRIWRVHTNSLRHRCDADVASVLGHEGKGTISCAEYNRGGSRMRHVLGLRSRVFERDSSIFLVIETHAGVSVKATCDFAFVGQRVDNCVLARHSRDSFSDLVQQQGMRS